MVKLNEILEALKTRILYFLRIDVCEACEILKIELDNEREERKYLQSVLFTNVRLTPQSSPEVDTSDLQPIRRHIPLRVAIARKEAEIRNHNPNVKAASEASMTEAEKLFEKTLSEKTN